MSNQKYADLHLHPATKAFLSSAIQRRRKDCWEFFPSISDNATSQSALSQLVTGGLHLAIAAIIPGERTFFQNFLIGDLASSLTVLNKKFAKGIAAGNFNYFDLLKGEIEHLQTSTLLEEAEDKNGEAAIIKRLSEAQEGRVNLILAIEGGHALGGLDDDNHIENLQTLLDEGYRFLYLTLTHLTDQGTNFLANHAFGTFNIKHNGFRPYRIGLSEKGKALIDFCYQQNPPILIDLKHMSLLSRIQFYEHYVTQSYTQPIIASHMGIAGISWKEFEKTHIEKGGLSRGSYKVVTHNPLPGIGKENNKHRDETYFNSWTINLFDEDIRWIANTGGIIGLNFDKKILGEVRKKDLKKLLKYENRFNNGDMEWIEEENLDRDDYLERAQEFFHQEEFEIVRQAETRNNATNLLENFELNQGHFSSSTPPAGQLTLNVNEDDFDQISEGERTAVRTLINNILHIVKVINHPNAWEHICVGSDFDGLITPISGAHDATDMRKLERMLNLLFPEMLQDAGKRFFIESGEDLKKRIRAIMYDNLQAFLAKHFVGPQV